ncbi:MAG: response regulator [Ignavibacteriales bacterium]|nr:response regulator [Ignavibacteriales bacterium]
MAELTPRDDTKKTVSEILKRVDQLLKAGSLDEAMVQIAKAREVDPKNVYVFAYEERLAVMKIEQKARDEAEKKRKDEEEQKRREEEARRSAQEAKRKAEEEARKKAEAERKQNEEVAKRARLIDSGTGGAEISREILDQTKQRILEDQKKKGLPPPEIPSGTPRGSAYDEGLEIYRRVLAEVWEDGAATEEENEQLADLRGSLLIRPNDHERLEKEAKREAYAKAFRRAWSSGAISPESASALADLRRKFNISIDEHEQIEAKLLWELRSLSQKAQIVVIDDDDKLLKVISDSLQDAGFQTLAFTTTDEAFKALKEITPDLILSDINLETSTMGGFSFYEKVREIERLHEIPFIFLSGLTDEVLIRTGKELGVDDYITKPFSHETLIATIKGKLKRYRQLKKLKK